MSVVPSTVFLLAFLLAYLVILILLIGWTIRIWRLSARTADVMMGHSGKGAPEAAIPRSER